MCLHIAIPPLTSYGSYIIVNQYYITLTGAIPLSRLYPVWAALIFNICNLGNAENVLVTQTL